ncbi:glycoside hydrolase [Lipomyces kononenkoae]|uniref:Glycoside hydrolase n=1 Tax=Lipomyces kononenkoae TaxID=34357 RepID=A0ACC3SQ99_LIPKO
MDTIFGFPWCFFILLLSAHLERSIAIDIDVDDPDSVKQAARVFAHGVLDYYNGNQTGGTLGKFIWPYYWWEAGAAWGSLLDYWFYTGDATFNRIVVDALLANVGPNNDYMPEYENVTEGNDDQAFWGFAIMAAAERNFTNPPSDTPQWQELSEAVFWSMAGRWDTSTCNGGLRWQIFEFNNGYDYKNTISNAGLFLMASRLARFTGNMTYVDWAERTWDWIAGVGLLDTEYYYFYDGASITDNCTAITRYQWSYNAACFLAGSAYLYNFTQSSLWENRTKNILDGLDVFFDNETGGVMYEVACEPVQKCNTDMQSFKAYLSRFMGLTAILAPWTYDRIYTHLVNTVANGVADSCTGGRDGVTCGTSWLVGGWDNTAGLGQQMSALETVQNLLINQVPAPYTRSVLLSSGPVGSLESGDNSSASNSGDRAGARPLSVLVLLLLYVSWLVVM